ncbi:MAG: hypothetical protein LVS60_10255 [Nodosilinea sp. LVE1205-7]|jgi:hypothetical protein
MARKQLFYLSLVVTVLSSLALTAMGAPLTNSQTPWGILSFELCAYGSSCTAIVQSWNSSVQLKAALSLGVDYLFMVAYSATLFLGLLMMADPVPPGLRRLTLGAAAAAWLAGAADALENYFLFQILLSPSNLQFAWPATASATVKFILLGFTLGWLAFTYLGYGPHQLFGKGQVIPHSP